MIRLAHVLYAVALLAAYVATSGGIGFICGTVVLCVWGFVFYSTDRPKTFFEVVAVAVVACCVGAIFVFAQAVQARPASRRTQCMNNLHQIGIALRQYHEEHGSFPPAYIADENGKPLLSWRVLLLPYLDLTALHREFDLSKPWDSPVNLPLSKHVPRVFACPSHHARPADATTTSYVAIVGPQTAWPGAESSTLTDMKDGEANIIMVIESHSPAIPWTEPRDLTLEEAVDALASEEIEPYGGHLSEDFFHEYFHGRSALFGDGRVQMAPLATDRTLAAELITIDDEKPKAGWTWVTSRSIPTEKLKRNKVICFAIAAFLTVLPVPWVWINPSGTMQRAIDERAEQPSQ